VFLCGNARLITGPKGRRRELRRRTPCRGGKSGARRRATRTAEKETKCQVVKEPAEYIKRKRRRDREGVTDKKSKGGWAHGRRAKTGNEWRSHGWL